MNLYSDLNELPANFRAGAMSIGNFDGVHRGHAQLVSQLSARARSFGGPAVIFTFEPHPASLLRPEQAPPRLTWLQRKAELLTMLGVDAIIAFPTSREFLALTPDEYFQQIICDHLQTHAIVEGPNFCFGRDRAGNTDTLLELCREHDIACDIVMPICEDNQFVSSSRVRAAIAAGKIDAANQMLTQPYQIRGQVTHGAGRGAGIGFPTANLAGVDTLLPGAGVYAGRTQIEQQDKLAAINIGPNPTFGEDQLKVEVHVLDFQGMIYGQMIEVEFLSRLRDIQQFESRKALQQQLDRDIDQVRAV